MTYQQQNLTVDHFESVFSTNSDTKTIPDRCLATNFWKRQIEIDSKQLILQTL